MRDDALVRLALAVIAVGIADDAFVHPEPGTAAGDHVASGLIPIAVLALLAAAYPRLRSGLRAALLIVVGVLAALAGTLDGVRHVVIAQPSGDDVTATLAAFAGVWLFCLGVVTLLRSRRLDEPRRGVTPGALSSPWAG